VTWEADGLVQIRHPGDLDKAGSHWGGERVKRWRYAEEVG
jgi:hypothetical protein